MIFKRKKPEKTWNEYRNGVQKAVPELFGLKSKIMPTATATVNLDGNRIALKELLNDVVRNLEFRIAASMKLLDSIKKEYDASSHNPESKDQLHFALHSYVLYLKTGIDALALLANYSLSLNLVRKQGTWWWYPDFDCQVLVQALNTHGHTALSQYVDSVKRSDWYVDLKKFRNASAHTNILEHGLVAIGGQGVTKVKLPDDPNAPPTLRGSSRSENIVYRCEPWYTETIRTVNSFCQILNKI